MKSDFLQSFRTFVHHYQWIHLTLGLIGNAAFVIGSIFFLWDSLHHQAILLFIIGSSGMLLGSIGSAIVKYEER
jgi:hypothetical protein